MPAHRKYDHHRILQLRASGVPWAEIAEQVGAPSPESIQSTFSKWCLASGISSSEPRHLRSISQSGHLQEVAHQDEDVEVTLGAPEVSRILSLDELVTFFRVDTSKWEVRDFRVNKWEQHSAAKGVVPLYQVRANLIRRDLQDAVEAARADIRQMLQEMDRPAPTLRAPRVSDGDPVLAVLNVYDPHLGMRAWGAETGGPDQDLDIAVRDYDAATERLLSLALIYPVEEVLYVVGHDLFHVDQVGLNLVGGTTARGTPQDVDTRQEKLFSTVRRAVVRGIDRARQVAPVRVRLVQGNHDPQQVYRLGEVLMAWYRNDPDVTVEYGPRRRTFFGYGANALMFCHGEEYKRHRDNLPLVFATECDPEIWVASTHREVLTGHWHKTMEGRYHPTSDMDETRGIRVRALPGLTAPDAWHANAGFRHTRAATLICYRRSGGVAGLHEHNP